eukprot:935885-Pelagomonas_calceolata.AAC.1
MQADVDKSSISRECRTSEFLNACLGLDRCNTFTRNVCSGQPTVMREFVADLGKRLQSVWNADAWAEIASA